MRFRAVSPLSHSCLPVHPSAMHFDEKPISNSIGPVCGTARLRSKNAGKNVTSQQAAASAPFNMSVTGVLATRDACNRLCVN